MPKLEPMQQPVARTGGRRARAMRVSSSLAEINVVPMIDVMLVLLVIFMVAAPMMQQGFEIQLPKSTQNRALKTQPITVTVPISFRKDQRVQLNTEAVRLDVVARADPAGTVGPRVAGRGTFRGRPDYVSGTDCGDGPAHAGRRQQRQHADATARGTHAMTATMSIGRPRADGAGPDDCLVARGPRGRGDGPVPDAARLADQPAGAAEVDDRQPRARPARRRAA